MLLSILATAFCAHFLSPQFLDQLSTTRAADGTEQSKLPRFTLLTAGGFILSAVPPRHPNPRPSPSPSPYALALALTLALTLALALALALTLAPSRSSPRCISPISPLYLPYISPASPLYLPSRSSRRW